MRSGAVGAKVGLSGKANTPNDPQHRGTALAADPPGRLPRPLTFWVTARRRGPIFPILAIDPAPRNTTPKVLPRCQVSIWGPTHQRTHTPGRMPLSFSPGWALRAANRPHSPHQSSGPFPAETDAGLEATDESLAHLSGPLHWKKQIRHRRSFLFFVFFKKFNHSPWALRAYRLEENELFFFLTFCTKTKTAKLNNRIERLSNVQLIVWEQLSLSVAKGSFRTVATAVFRLTLRIWLYHGFPRKCECRFPQNCVRSPNPQI